jgi:signal peptidase II
LSAPGTPPGGPPGTGERRRRIAVVFGVAAVALVADQVTKSLAVEYLRSGPVHLFGPFSLQLTYNSGIAFSVGVGLTVPIILVVVVTIAMLVWFARSVPSLPAAVAVGLVLGGAIGNLSDRLFRGHGGAVVDFLHSTFWPTFNVADSCVVCGCFLLAGSVLFQRPATHDAGGEPAQGPDSTLSPSPGGDPAAGGDERQGR